MASFSLHSYIIPLCVGVSGRELSNMISFSSIFSVFFLILKVRIKAA